MSEVFTFVGNLKNGEAIYRSKAGSIAIEKDFTYLVTATSEELAQFLDLYPGERKNHADHSKGN